VNVLSCAVVSFHFVCFVVYHLIRWYCREAGVRSLQKYVEKVYRKVALKIARNPTGPQLLITAENLKDYAGTPNYSSDRLYETTPVGVATVSVFMQQPFRAP
jgi:ATP-dependent Lon protease